MYRTIGSIDDRHRPVPHALTLLFVALGSVLMFAFPGAAQGRPESRVTVVTSPEALPRLHDRKRIFLGGSIDMGTAPNWQREVIAALQDEDVVVLNPRRPDWNPTWKPEASDKNFRRQVDWELAALDSSDIILLYLAPGTMSPVSLLEMGLHAHGGKLIVLCPDGFWRKGNVDITAHRYGVKQVGSLTALISEARKRLRAK